MEEMRMIKNQSQSSMQDFQTFAKASEKENTNVDSKNSEPEFF